VVRETSLWRRLAAAGVLLAAATSLACLVPACRAKAASAPPSPDPYGPPGPEAAESYTDTSVWELAWSDEFSGAVLDPDIWNFSEGATGWGNVELQEYTIFEKNVRLRDGALVIEALRDPAARNGYSSGRINTKLKREFTYGRVEVRAKIPQAPHIWPCIWLLGDTNGKPWPNCGEIDIAEVSGKEPRTVGGALHGPGYSGGRYIGGKITLPYSLSASWRVASLEWDPNEIRWYMDGKLFFKAGKADIPSVGTWVFDHPFYVIINLAVGGNLAEFPTSKSAFPQTMLVDYVRVYRRK
jgi:beta-glucanase (GH16 family)